MQVRVNPDAFPAMVDPEAHTAVRLGNDAIVILHADPRANPNAGGDYVIGKIFQSIGVMEQRLADIETVIANLPGCARPQEGDLPSLFATVDAMRDALARIHDLCDARAAMLAAMQTASMGKGGEG